MNIRQLACFVAVVDEGSFTRAARAIGIAQPSLSQHIRALEEGLNGLKGAETLIRTAEWGVP